MKSIFRGRSGELENTVFGMFDPTGKRSLVRSGRSPDFAFNGSPTLRISSMAKKMQAIAKTYPLKQNVEPEQAQLPYISDLRLAVNITACDNLPLLIVAGDDTERAKLEAALKPVAWTDPWIGKFSYVAVSDLSQLSAIEGCKAESGIVFVQPDQFGVKAKVLAQLPMGADEEKFNEALQLASTNFKSFRKDTRQYHRDGSRAGVHWETAIPVTDPHSRNGGPPPRRR